MLADAALEGVLALLALLGLLAAVALVLPDLSLVMLSGERRDKAGMLRGLGVGDISVGLVAAFVGLMHGTVWPLVGIPFGLGGLALVVVGVGLIKKGDRVQKASTDARAGAGSDGEFWDQFRK